MGSSGDGDVHCIVGTIVWVRRRNGSWWPGKILGPDELLASHVMSPRSGTPVKLLGREDASVDWYNLEKSKRVKAFRCGDFDDCIERAESSLGMPSKKREKYARREDAILHALELESQLLGDKHGKLATASDSRAQKLSDAKNEDLVTSSESLGNESRKFRNSKSHQVSKKFDSSQDDVMSRAAHENEEGNQMSCEDEFCNAMPRMRGLQDFAFKSDSLKQIISSPVPPSSGQRSTEDNPVDFVDGFNISTSNHANSLNSFEKRKMIHKGLSEESTVKRRDRRRPLVQVLQSSAKFPISHFMQTDSDTVSMSVSGDAQTGATCRGRRSRCVSFPSVSSDCLDQKENSSIPMHASPRVEVNHSRPHHSSLNDGCSSHSTEDDESDSSKTDCMETDTEEEALIASDSVGPPEAEHKIAGQSEMEEHESMSSDGLGEGAGDMSNVHFHGAPGGGGMSEWQLKGKRNIRNFMKKAMDPGDGRGSDEVCLDEKGKRASVERFGLYPRNDDFGMGVAEPDSDFNNTHAVGYPLASKAAPKIVDWDEFAWEDRPVLKGYWEENDPVFVGRRHYNGRTKSVLVDVDLKVQASYRKEHVPIVSLMSRLNGKAIIGHPIQIEALDDGFSKALIPRNDDFANESFDNDVNATLTPVWRTARRTANRTRRSHPPPIWDGEDEQVPFDKGKRPQFKRLSTGTTSLKGNRTRGGLGPDIPRPPGERKVGVRKPQRKGGLPPSQKIRTLSSIAVEQRAGNKLRQGWYADGLIKPAAGPTTVACIPVKLVFSRLFEGVVRPLSRTNGGVGRDSS